MALLQSETNERESLYMIAYGSKILTNAKTLYANIETELLGVVSGSEKIHYFTFGMKVMILTDHKPLIAISKKALVNAPPRLQHLLLRMNNNNVELIWIPGKEMVFSNHLSRNIQLDEEKPVELTCQGLDLKIQDIYLNASDNKCLSLASETDKDEILVALKSQIIKGWPSIRSKCSSNLLN